MALESINPANGKLLRRFDPLDATTLREKIARAHVAFRDYGHVPIEHRALCMRKLASILDSEAEDLARIITIEMGKPIAAARQEILKCAGTCLFYAEEAARMLAPESIPTEAAHSYVRWDPIGVLLAVMPWNFPFWQVFRCLAPALMAGNVVLLKHAANVPQCALAIESLVSRSGFPSGTFQALLIDVQAVESVLADDRVVAVTVTGSEAAGRAIGAQAGWLIKKSVMELGGSDPFIVMTSADLERAAEMAVRARLINSGQSCIAAKRFLVAAEIYDRFTERFVAGMREMVVGDPMNNNTDVGPLATKRLLEDLELQVGAAVKSGARVLTGGHRIRGLTSDAAEDAKGEGNFFQPTVIEGVPRTSPVYREELFGPVAMLFRVRNLDEAIALANDTPFGLGASVWTRDPAEQQRLIAELECGMVFLNTIVVSDPRLPFGGVKHSGFGRELSAFGMREFMNAKTVVISSPPSAPSPLRNSGR